MLYRYKNSNIMDNIVIFMTINNFLIGTIINNICK